MMTVTSSEDSVYPLKKFNLALGKKIFFILASYLMQLMYRVLRPAFFEPFQERGSFFPERTIHIC